MMSRLCRVAESDLDFRYRAWTRAGVRALTRRAVGAPSRVRARAVYKSVRADARPPVPFTHSIASSAVKSAWDINADLILVRVAAAVARAVRTSMLD